ncbi:MAG TPA: ATP-binding cassette domain-containing protein [Thermoanaerobaculia bacterium]
MRPGGSRRRFLAPEVVQTSAIDCGPAALKALLAGFGLPASYGRLREACQTDVDGTSIDTVEEVAGQLGLVAEQVLRPADHLLLSRPELLPAVVVVRQPVGGLHFVVVWRRTGRWLQVMDPAVGRRWELAKAFLGRVHVHSHPASAAAWRSWAGGGEMRAALARHLAEAGCSPAASEALLAEALEDPGWRSLATLDAAARLVRSLVEAGSFRRGAATGRLVAELFRQAAARPEEARRLIPEGYWPVAPREEAGGGDERDLWLRGAVLVRVRGRREEAAEGAAPAPAGRPAAETMAADAGAEARARPAPAAAAAGEEPAEPAPRDRLSPAMADIVRREETPPGRVLLDLLRREGTLRPALLAAAFAATGAGLVVEALLLRGFLDLVHLVALPPQRLVALGMLLAFVAALGGVSLPALFGALALGRRLEGRLRLAFLRKVPLLGDRFFHSRPLSDMAERGHMVHAVRGFPELAGRLVRSASQLALTAAGLVWLAPGSAGLVALVLAVSLGLPLVAQALLAERDLKARTHAGALTRFYLDTLLGAAPVRSHGAERAVRREHEALLVEQARSFLDLLRATVALGIGQSLLGFGLAAALVALHAPRAGAAGTLLLFVYWTLQLPGLGQELAMLLQQYPGIRNVTLRLAEPLGAPEAERPPERGAGGADADAPRAAAVARGVAVRMAGVAVRASGHTLLSGIDLALGPGEHVAVVGPSGAGKSTLLGLLLGWHRAAAGRLEVDGRPLDPAADPEALFRLRRQTAWVDPGVRLWNRSLLDNLRYGAPPETPPAVGAVLEEAALLEVLETLPRGLATVLGEGGGRLSGGEGQRVRLGRALLRPAVRLALLDEPFRGLDRPLRRRLLATARRRWRAATLLCVTHDLADAAGFDRVVVLDGGRLVEDGPPAALAADPGSRFARLLAAEEGLARSWRSPRWRRLRLAAGAVEGEAVEPS